MPTSNSLKGLHSLRTIQTMRKDAETEKENSDYLKLFMLEKERTRIRNEQIRLTLRLEILNTRLKEIEEFYAATLGLKSDKNSNAPETAEEEPEPKKEWNTIPLKY